ncbi:CPBP family intramembrane metalloprotease [Granulicella sp. WH15]|uniref:CPBP family intramembrane glutamic endopeptidase n=1 Tax=Granulicella sp. WH15 TaxID=2602070 RepID=UPI0013669E93|nr:CPBP family intramembrane glutamic endopeptidase [Granulicella sp. WH15]QHN03545.1 CPBP family intramembrane metalloprotease [Granulicella sp. WH15]
MPPPPIPTPRFFSLVLTGTALLWAMASGSIADRSARGVTMRLGLYLFNPLLTELFLLFLLLVGFWMLERISSRSGSMSSILTLPLRKGWSREWALGAAAGWGMILAATLPVLLSGNLHGRMALASNSWVLIPLGLATLAVSTLAQEVVFRGYPFRRLVDAVGPTWASLLLSLLFALVLVRQNPPRHIGTAMLVEIAFGLVLSMAYLRTHGLWLSWGLHFAYWAVAGLVLGLPMAGHTEFTSVMATFATGPLWLGGGSFGVDGARFTLLVMAAGFAVVFRLTRWYAWEYTHAPIVAGGYEVTVAPPPAHAAMEKQAAAAPPPLVQILPATPQGRSVEDEPLS